MSEGPPPPRKWLASGRAFVLIAAGVLAFSVSTLVPLLRKEIAPAFFTKEIIDVDLRVIGDYSHVYVRNKRDGIVYARESLPAVLRISSKSEFPVTIDNIFLEFRHQDYPDFNIDDWESDYVYYGGADVQYETFFVKLSDADQSPISILSRASFGMSGGGSSNRFLIYKIPPYETEYVFFWLEYSSLGREDWSGPFGLILSLSVDFMIKGNSATQEIDSPVHLLLGLQSDPEPPSNERGSLAYLLSEDWIYSGYQVGMEESFRAQESREKGQDPITIRARGLDLSKSNIASSKAIITQSIEGGKPWAVILGGFESRTRAQALAVGVQAPEEMQVATILRDKLHRVAVLGFETREQAQVGAASIRLEDDGAYAVDLRAWCSSYESGSGIIRCCGEEPDDPQ